MLRRTTVTFALIVTYLALWAVLKPPLQSPDEPQHLLRAAAVWREPWISSSPEWLALEPRLVNPIAAQPPAALGKLFFHGERSLLPQDVSSLKATPWDMPGQAPERAWTPLASYPPGYYGAVLLLAETTRAWILPTPYQQTYVYRFWTLLMASVLWTLVYLVLRRLPETSARAELLLAFLLLNAMLAFVTSATTPDAVNIPLATLAVLLTYRALMHEQPRSHVLAALALAACLLTKPSGLLIFGGLCGATVLLWRLRLVSARQAAWTALTSIVPTGIAWLIFYAWSPLAFRASTPQSLPVTDYLISLLTRAPKIASAYWGKLGWRDYHLPLIWYALLFALLAVNAALMARALWKTRGGRGVRGGGARPVESEAQPVTSFVIFTAAVFAGYVVLMAFGEYRYLPMAGENFQGRHLLPASIGLAGLVSHDEAWARRLLIGYLAIMNVAFMHASIVRYFGGNWSAFWQSLPW